MTDFEQTITLVYEGRRLEVSIEFFSHLLNCGSNYVSESEQRLKEEPLDWDSSHVNLQFESRKESLRICQETIELAQQIREFLKGD